MKLQIKPVIYWLAYAYYVYIVAPAAIKKIIEATTMMNNMHRLGFTREWTILIGVFETAGIAIVLLGLWKPVLRTVGVLLLFPFAIGAFSTHMAHQEYHHYINSLMFCILSIILLALSGRIKIDLSNHKKLG